MGRPRLFTDEERKARHRVVSLKYYEENKAKCNASARKWTTNNLEKVRELERLRFKKTPEKNYLKGVKYRTNNKAKRRQTEQSWRERNRGKARAIGHRYRAKKYLAKGSKYTTAAHIEGRWKLFDGKCWICGILADHTDHVKPLDVGGSHLPSNLRPICISCNSRKKNRWPIPTFVFTRVESPSTLAMRHLLFSQ